VVGAKSAGLVSAEHGGSFRDVVSARRESAAGTEDQS
jgi:hypothetical protein